MPQVIKIEDEGNHAPFGQPSAKQELMNRFRNNVPPPPVHQPEPQPLPPPPSPALSTRAAKRLLSEPPPGFAGVRHPPLKSPYQTARVQTHHHVPQPPPPNVHRAPGSSLPPPPPPARHDAVVAVPLPATNNAVVNVKPPLQRRKPPPKHPAVKKKPTVPCGLCGVLCMTARHLKDHEKGRKHRNKAAILAGEMNVMCPVCNVHFSFELNVEQNYAGKQHLRQLKLNGGA
ncbi:unnamed protein product [Urochloa humidicola]